jgi:hypothetical protein
MAVVATRLSEICPTSAQALGAAAAGVRVRARLAGFAVEQSRGLRQGNKRSRRCNRRGDQAVHQVALEAEAAWRAPAAQVLLASEGACRAVAQAD